MSLPIPSTSGSPIDPKQLQAMDAPLIALTNSCGGDLRRLMFAYFSFLHRRTDFYLVPHDDDVKAGKYMGFPEGDAEKFLLAAFRQFPLRKIPKGGPQRAAAGGGGKPTAAPTKAVDKASTTKKETPKEETSKPAAEAKSKEATAVEKSPAASEQESSSSNDDNKAKKTPSSAANMEGVRYNEEGLQIPVGNGGSMPKYKWTQMIDECSVLIGVPPGLRGKDLNIKITPTTLSVKTKKPLVLPGQEQKDQQQQQEPLTLMEGKLTHKVRADESTWSMEGGAVIVTLDKLEKTFWKSILEGDEEIDTEEVDNRRHISEYDDVTQGQIRKTIFDQNQYHLGGKTSDEILSETNGGESNNKKPQIPEMPPGVEYIDQTKLDEVEKVKKTAGGAKQTTGADGAKQKYTIDLDKK